MLTKVDRNKYPFFQLKLCHNDHKEISLHHGLQCAYLVPTGFNTGFHIEYKEMPW